MPVLDFETERHLLGIARASIRHGLEHGKALRPRASGLARPLARPGAAFVSLHRGPTLRGCVGTLEARRPLAVDVAENAFAAAFRDHRMAPVACEEFDQLSVEIHVLGPLLPMPFHALEELYAQLHVGSDGLSLELGPKHAVFLPVMWEQLPSPATFVTHLLRKAGIAPGEPLGALRASRFGVQLIREEE